MKDYLNEFKLYLKNVKKSSENTIQSYIRDLIAYINYCKVKGIKDLAIVSEEFITEYIKYLEQSISNSSIKRIASSLKCYYKFLQSLNLCQKLNISCLKTSKKIARKIPTILEQDEILRLIEQPDTSQIKGIRDKAMLELLYATGITVTELITLNVNAVNLTLGILNIKNRTIPLYNDAVKTMSLYINQVRNILTCTNETKLFSNLNGDPLTRQGVWKIIKEYVSKANLNKDITPHTIRHTFAVHLLENGADICQIKTLLGHTSSTSAQIYVDILKAKYSKSYFNYHPLSK